MLCRRIRVKCDQIVSVRRNTFAFCPYSLVVITDLEVVKKGPKGKLLTEVKFVLFE